MNKKNLKAIHMSVCCGFHMPAFQDTANSHEKLALQDDISVVKETTLKRLTEVKNKNVII